MKKIVLISLLSLMIVACNKDASAKEVPQNIDLSSVFSDDFEGFDEIVDKENCMHNGGAWIAEGDILSYAVEEAAAECICFYDDHGYHWLDGWDASADGAQEACSGEGCVYTAAVPAMDEERASANVCHAPDYSTINCVEDCWKAHGVWTDALGNEGEDGYMPARCFPWVDGE